MSCIWDEFPAYTITRKTFSRTFSLLCQPQLYASLTCFNGITLLRLQDVSCLKSLFLVHGFFGNLSFLQLITCK